MIERVTGKIAFKEDWNVVVPKGAYLHVLHADDFDDDEFKKLKVGDKVSSDSWYKIKLSVLSNILKSNKKKEKNVNSKKPIVFLDAPVKIKHKTYSFGSLPDGAIINGYILASKGGQHFVYCAKNCFFDNKIDSGVGSVNICVKRGNFYYCKYKNDNLFRGWRNVGEDSISNFYNRFIDGNLHDYSYDGWKEPKAVKEDQLLKIFKKIDAIELAEARKQLKDYKKVLA